MLFFSCLNNVILNLKSVNCFTVGQLKLHLIHSVKQLKECINSNDTTWFRSNKSVWEVSSIMFHKVTVSVFSAPLRTWFTCSVHHRQRRKPPVIPLTQTDHVSRRDRPKKTHRPSQRIYVSSQSSVIRQTTVQHVPGTETGGLTDSSLNQSEAVNLISPAQSSQSEPCILSTDTPPSPVAAEWN